MFNLDAILATANKHWKLCTYYLLLGYCIRVVQAIVPQVTVMIVQDLAISLALIIPGSLIGNKFSKTDNELENNYYQQAIVLTLLIGLLVGRSARFIIAGR